VVADQPWGTDMKILATDVYSGKQHTLTGKFDMDHVSSSYGLPIMLIEEWGNKVMSHKQWLLDRCEVVEIDEEDQEFFNHWRSALIY
jgi:hypothetical protein